MQSDLFAPDESVVLVPKKSAARPAKKEAAGQPDDDRPNLNILDVRIYGVQVPIDLPDCSYRFDGMTPEQIAEYRKKSFPLKCVYDPEDFTDVGKVEILRQRGYSFWQIAEQFPDLADAATRMAIDTGKAIT